MMFIKLISYYTCIYKYHTVCGSTTSHAQMGVSNDMHNYDITCNDNYTVAIYFDKNKTNKI